MIRYEYLRMEAIGRRKCGCRQCSNPDKHPCSAVIAIGIPVAKAILELCDRCFGEPGGDLGGCFRCGGSGLRKDHQPLPLDAGEYCP